MVTVFGIKLRNFIALAVGCLLFIAEGINYSQLAPFFPTEAETKKGLDAFHVGIVNSSFDVAIVSFTAVLAVVSRPELNKFFFLWGAVIGAVALICFGVLARGPGGWCYLFMCLLCRVLMGVGANMLWSTGIPLLTSLSPQHSGKITSLTESGVGLGFAVGPPIGSLLYSMGGYVYPFVCCGLMELALLLVAVFTIPTYDESNATKSSVSAQGSEHVDDDDDDDDDDDEILLNNGPTVSESVQFDDVDILPGIKSESQRSGTKKDDKYLSAFRALLSYPGIWCVSSYLLVGSVPFGLFNVAMGPYLLRHYDIEGDCSGYYFLVIGATYAVIAQFVGVIVDKGCAPYLFFWNNISSVLVTFLFTLPLFWPQIETKVFLVTMLALTGVVQSCTFVPLYVIMENVARRGGFLNSDSLDNLRLKIAIWIQLIMSIGKIIGSVILGGIVYKYVNFYWTMVMTSIFYLIGALISNSYLLVSGNYRKLFYQV